MRKDKLSTEYLVIGAGLTGSGIALELARRGKSVVLVEQDDVPMNRASLRNEGKIHLGLIYAGDGSGNTGRQQLKGSLCFHPILRSWLGDSVDKIELSTPFVYLVANDSLLSPEQLEHHYQSLEAEYLEIISEHPHLNYLGHKPEWLARSVPLDTLRHTFNIRQFKKAFSTNERAVNTDDLAREITAAINRSDEINFIPRIKVVDIIAHQDAYTILGKLSNGDDYLEVKAKTVFNAAWDQRLHLDSLAGIVNPSDWVHRLKYRVIASIPQDSERSPSATIVLGAYGDVVIRNKSAFLSWYPSGMTGWSHDLAPPADWDLVCKRFASDPKSELIGREILAQTLQWYPSLLGSNIMTIDAGAIFAYGRSDIHHLESKLHDRSCIGVRANNNFFSIDPGKLTTAPMYAVEAVEQALCAR